MGLVLDTGALLAFERGDRAIAALLEAARRRGEAPRTSSGCVAQAWRGGGPRQALLARVLRGVQERALEPRVSRSIGEILGRTAIDDVVDGHVALLARAGDLVLSSDPDHVRKLLRAAGTRAEVLRC
jgi:hypothetical protein